jgi:hypothetical protein
MNARATVLTLTCLLALATLSTWGSLSEHASPRPRVLILMFSTPGIVPVYAGAAAAINEAYARRYGYGFTHVVQHTTSHAETVWKMVEVLRAHQGQADALFWIDSDAVFNPARHSQSLEWLFGLPGDIIGCSDHPNGSSFINTGTLFVKNTPEASKLLDAWWAMRGAYSKAFPYEQQALHDLAKAHPSAIRARPANEFNSIIGELRAGKRETFVLHFMSFAAHERATELAKLSVTSASAAGSPSSPRSAG